MGRTCSSRRGGIPRGASTRLGWLAAAKRFVWVVPSTYSTYSVSMKIFISLLSRNHWKKKMRNELYRLWRGETPVRIRVLAMSPSRHLDNGAHKVLFPPNMEVAPFLDRNGPGRAIISLRALTPGLPCRIAATL